MAYVTRRPNRGIPNFAINNDYRSRPAYTPAQSDMRAKLEPVHETVFDRMSDIVSQIRMPRCAD